MPSEPVQSLERYLAVSAWYRYRLAINNVALQRVLSDYLRAEAWIFELYLLASSFQVFYQFFASHWGFLGLKVMLRTAGMGAPLHLVWVYSVSFEFRQVTGFHRHDPAGGAATAFAQPLRHAQFAEKVATTNAGDRVIVKALANWAFKWIWPLSFIRSFLKVIFDSRLAQPLQTISRLNYLCEPLLQLQHSWLF